MMMNTLTEKDVQDLDESQLATLVDTLACRAIRDFGFLSEEEKARATT